MRDWEGLAMLRVLLVFGLLWFALALITACGTLEIGLDESGEMLEPAVMPTSAESTAATAGQEARESVPAVAWYGTIHSIPGDDTGNDYLKPWHLDIWPKLSPAVGLSGADPAVDAEIERLRDTDVKATFWGDLTCGVSDYGACQLLVERLSANDGGPHYGPDKVEGWLGSIGRLPAQPGSQNYLLYFILEGEVIALYGIASAAPSIQAELERLSDGDKTIRIWGDLDHKAQPVTGTVIDVVRLEDVAP